MAMGRRFASQESDGLAHDWLILVPEGHAYARFVSDLAGFDPGKHNSSQESIVPVVMSWLWTRPDDAVTAMEPDQVLEALPRFEAAKEQLDTKWANKPPWNLVIAEARYAIPA
jgi:predicted phosphoadenosine phosphosulfate sulfurtransferase